MMRVIDTETTGLEPPAGVCEIGWCDLTQTGLDWTVGRPDSILVNPGHPIPPEASAIHHIVTADVRDAAPLAEIVPDALLSGLPARRIFAAHNATFDRQFLTDELMGPADWICTYRCALRVWPQAPAHTNSALRYWLNPYGLDHAFAMPPHRAGPDTYVTAFVLLELLWEVEVAQLVAWSKEPALQVRCYLKKHRGLPWSEVPTDYLLWASGQNMDEDVAFTVRHHLALRREADRRLA